MGISMSSAVALKKAAVLLSGAKFRISEDFFLADNEKWVAVVNSDELKSGEIKGTKIGAIDIAVYNVEGTFYATGNICSHAYALLSDGFLDGDVVECPLHAGAFDVKTGKAVCAPAGEDVKSYPTRLVGNEVQVRVD